MNTTTGSEDHIRRSDSVHHQAELLDRWDQQYSQLGSGLFSGSVTMCRNGAARLFREDLNLDVYQVGGLSTPRIAFGFPLRFDGNCFLCGEAARIRDLLVFSGQSGFEFLSPRDFEFYGVEFDASKATDPVLAAMLDELSDVFASGRRSIRLDPSQANNLSSSLVSLFHARAAAEATPWSAEQTNAINRQIAGSTLDCLPADAAGGPRSERHWDVISAVRDLVRDNPYCPRSVAELTIELGISRRTLQNVCQDILGISPVHFLRVLRLNEARRAIEATQSVTQAATQFGFWHLSYFARDYRALFGELPSITLERVRR